MDQNIQKDQNILGENSSSVKISNSQSGIITLDEKNESLEMLGRNAPEQGIASYATIDIKIDDKEPRSEDFEEKVCRICHLDYESKPEKSELIQLGCGCKGDLGTTHRHCAEVWFKLKGNRYCEICGESAENITGIGDNRFMEEWNERRILQGSSSAPDPERSRCWRGQPLCNFLMVCLVIAFILPWFFRINMF